MRRPDVGPHHRLGSVAVPGRQSLQYRIVLGNSLLGAGRLLQRRGAEDHQRLLHRAHGFREKAVARGIEQPLISEVLRELPTLPLRWKWHWRSTATMSTIAAHAYRELFRLIEHPDESFERRANSILLDLDTRILATMGA